MKNSLLKKINNKTARIGILGLGYVGLPHLIRYVENGFYVTGYDIDKNKINSLNNYNSYIEDVPSSILKKYSEYFHATYNFNSLSEEDIIFIDVPTPTLPNKLPDFTYVKSACDEVLKNVRKGQIIILESTVSPGTTYNYIVKKLMNNKFNVGEDIFVGYSPERIDPGNKEIHFSEITRIISGYSDSCLEIMEALFKGYGYSVSSLEVAELTKLYENTFRFINIAFVDELSRLTEKMNISFDEVSNAANSKEYGFMKFSPSYGIGGHCIPVDPFYLLDYAHTLETPISLIEQSANINDAMIYRLLRKIYNYMISKKYNDIKIAIVGASYKPNIKDTRMSVVKKLSERLMQEEINFTVFDNIEATINIHNYDIPIKNINYDVINNHDLAIILQEHEYVNLNEINIDKIFATRF